MRRLTTSSSHRRERVDAPRLVWLWLLTLCCLLGMSTAQALEANVDRAVVSEGDSLTLTIRRDGRDSSGEPDYSPLQGDFHLFGSRQSNRSVISSGGIEAWTEWQITLIPKRSGQLTIPSLAVGGAMTAPIQVEVRAAQASGTTDQQRDPVFIEATVDGDEVYVEQQLLLTVRVFHALALEDMQLSDPEPEHARTSKLAQSNFRRDIDGVTYQVHELVYAIFAEQPGELVIPELVFRGRQPQRSRSFFDFPGQGRALRRMSQPLTVTIKPIPSTFSGTTWLPARNLTLVESWNGSPDQLAVGDSMTRSLTLRADGIDAAHLPALTPPTVDGGRLYADQPQLDDSTDERGVQGKRTQSAALIATRPGPLQLPGTRLVWWDVDSDSEQVAEIAPRQLQIRPAPQGVNKPAATTTHPAQAPTVGAANTQSADVDNTQLLGWQITAALLACGWAATLWWGWRRQPSTAAPTAHDESGTVGEKAALKSLRRACIEQQPERARAALLQWGTELLGPEQTGLEALLRWANSPELEINVRELESTLYSSNSVDGWRGEKLLAAIEALHKSHRAKKSGSVGETLPPLYPSR